MKWLIIDAEKFEKEVLECSPTFWGLDMKPVIDTFRRASKGVYLNKE